MLYPGHQGRPVLGEPTLLHSYTTGTSLSSGAFFLLSLDFQLISPKFCLSTLISLLQVSATVKCFLDASFALGKLRHSEVLLLQVSHHTYLLLPRAGSLLDQRRCPGMNSLMQPLDLLSARSRAPDVHWDNWLRLRSPLKCRAQNSSCEPRWICSKREHKTAYLPSSLLCSGHEAKQEEGVWSKIQNRRQK